MQSLDDGVRGRMWSRPRRTNGNDATLCKSSYTLLWTEDATVSNIALVCGRITFYLQPVGGLSRIFRPHLKGFQDREWL